LGVGAKPAEVAPGRIDDVAFAEPGRYLVGRAVLDTRTLAVRVLPIDAAFETDTERRPLVLSPDGRSLVRLGRVVDEARQLYVDALGVTDLDAGRTEVLRIDRRLQRYAAVDALDAAWVERHFSWTAGADGVERLVARGGPAPTAHHGRMDGDSWFAAPGDDRLRDALVDVLVAEVGARRLADPDVRERRVRIDGRVVSVIVRDGGRVTVAPVYEQPPIADAATVARVGLRLDVALATGRYDPLFLAH
jgi:hypothetical protein